MPARSAGDHDLKVRFLAHCSGFVGTLVKAAETASS
jgi:hypothetical protein